jgi:L-aminopeptidase/D-esterase-like protein
VLTEVSGVAVGHWTDTAGKTGCTVVLLPEATVASGVVAGGAPATREFELLQPDRLMSRVDAVVLSGGSAFGLAAADGVVDWLAERGRGFPTGGGPVPIVVGMCVFDLLEGDGAVRPTAAAGRTAADAATAAPVEVGRIGAGAGCTIDKWLGPDRRRPGALVGHAIHHGEVVVAALVAVNAFGSIDDGSSLADRLPEPGTAFRPSVVETDRPDGEANTTIGVVVTNATLDKIDCHRVAEGAHDGLARAVAPSHTRVDGDAFVAAATGEIADVAVDEVRFLAVAAVEAAIRTLAV